MLKRAVNAQTHALRSHNWGQFGALLHRIRVWQKGFFAAQRREYNPIVVGVRLAVAGLTSSTSDKGSKARRVAI